METSEVTSFNTVDKYPSVHGCTLNTSYCSPSECGSTVAMRTSTAEVNQSQGNGSSGQCFSNPSYHTVAQCNVVSNISGSLDGTLILKV